MPKNIFYISDALVLAWCFAAKGQRQGSTPRARATTPPQLSDAPTRRIFWNCAALPSDNGGVIPPASWVFLFWRRSDMKENLICLRDQAPSRDPRRAAQRYHHGSLRTRAVATARASSIRGAGLRWQGDGLDDLTALFISDFCFYDSQSWWPRRSEGISKQNVQSRTDRWQVTFNSEKCKLIYLGKNNLKQRYSMVTGNVARSKSKRNTRAIKADYRWVTRSFQNCLGTLSTCHLGGEEWGRRFHPPPPRACPSTTSAALNAFAHAHCCSADS